MDIFCTNCNNILDIVKKIDIIKINNIIELIEKLLISSINLDSNISYDTLIKSEEFKKLNDSNQELVKKNYNLYKNLNNIGFYKCFNCGYFKQITNGTSIINNTKSNVYNSDIILKLQSNNSILPRTRDYICPNSECKANDPKFKEREAVFYRNKNSYNLKYLCTVCTTEWDIN